LRDEQTGVRKQVSSVADGKKLANQWRENPPLTPEKQRQADREKLLTATYKNEFLATSAAKRAGLLAVKGEDGLFRFIENETSNKEEAKQKEAVDSDSGIQARSSQENEPRFARQRPITDDHDTILGARAIHRGAKDYASWSEAVKAEGIEPTQNLYRQAQAFHAETERAFMSPEAKAAQRRKEGLRRSIGDLQQRVENEDLTPKPKRPEPTRDPEELKLRGQREELINSFNQLLNRAKDRQQPALVRGAKAIQGGLFSMKVFGHGTVGMQTHAGALLFRPTQWNLYFRNFSRQFGLMFNKDYHTRAMQTLREHPLIARAKSAGLEVDPSKGRTDYAQYAEWARSSPIGWLRNIANAGSRGFDALKLYRMDMFEREVRNLPRDIATDSSSRKEIEKMIATDINHWTGFADIGHGPLVKGAQTLMFAPKLEASRWARIAGDPIKIINSLGNIATGKASRAETYQTRQRIKMYAEIAAVYFGSLAANQAILSATGSKQKINMTDPRKADYMMHKGLGFVGAFEGRLMSPVRLLAQIIQNAYGERSKIQQATHETRLQSTASDVLKYGRGKLAPLPALAADVFDRKDFAGRPLPFSDEKPRYADQKKYTWPEYLSQQGPIPAAMVTREVYNALQDKGIPDPQARAFMNGLVAFATGGVGAHVHEEHESTANPTTDYRQVHRRH
jgi:hypothetical protein